MAVAVAPVSAINLDLLETSEVGGSTYPSLVSSNYRPQTLDEVMSLALPDDQLEKLSDEAKIAIAGCDEMIQVALGGERVPCHGLASAEWIITCRPARGFIIDSSGERKKVRRKGQNEEWDRDTMTTTNRLLLLCRIKSEIVTDSDGMPQIFTLSLKGSNRSKWIYGKEEFEGRHIDGLNEYWLKRQKKELADQGVDVSRIKSNSWVLHLCSIAIDPVAYGSDYEGQRNIYTRYQFRPKAQPKNLTPEQQQLVSRLVRSEEFIELKKDPFGIDRMAQEDINPPAEQTVESATSDGHFPTEADYDEIEF